MLRVLTGKIEPTKGNVSKPVAYTIGYLSQDLVAPSSKTVFAETYGALEELTSLQAKMEDHGVQLTERTDYETESYLKLIEDMNDVTERFNLLGGHQADADVEKVLFGLGFKQSDLNRPVSEFSGGWQMRVELAKILVQRPDLLLLDEPTNHLDIVSIQWLESFLSEHHGSVILVSHDRAFLDNVTLRTIEISLGKIYDYKTNYSSYVLQRAERKEQQLAAYENQRKFIEETERFIDRFRAKATKANQVQSRIKALEKIDRIEVDQEDKSTMRFRFPPAPRAGKVVIECSGVGKNYGDLNVFFRHRPSCC
jgi:ATP-binding cassette subfamily F protein 3